jgi:muramoyltetrapeptide carboxypeptidase
MTTANHPFKPARLEFGDTVGIIAPASPPPDPNAVDRAAATLEKFGFKPKLSAHVRARHGFLAGGDTNRAADLMAMFADENVRAIFCLRGGYGTARILNLLDYDFIRRNPKIFIGYSDITALHCAFSKNVKMISFHAPMLNGGLADENLPDFTRDSFLRTVMTPQPPGSIVADSDKKNISTLRCGIAEGRLIGGNLSVLVTTLGTPFQPKFHGRILLLEDVGEKPYRLDRMLTHLWNAGIFQQVAGVAVGVNSDCEDSAVKPGGEYRQNSADVFMERLANLKVPVVMGLPFGHVAVNATLPIGARAKLDGDNGDLIITEAAVS